MAGTVSFHKIFGQIILLTKSIWLAEPQDQRGFAAQFIPGRRNLYLPPAGIGLSWWYTKRAFKSVEVIASMILQSVPGLESCDPETVEETIRHTLQQRSTDVALFKPDEILCSHAGNLFEHRSIDSAADFAADILESIIESLRSKLTARCTIYVAPRIEGPTFAIANEGITALSRSDLAGWSDIERRGYRTNGWTPVTGKFAYGNDLVFSNLKYDYVFLCEDTGTRKGCHSAAALKFRRLFAVIFAAISEGQASRLLKCAGAPYRMSLQFVGPNSTDGSICMDGFEPLAPYYADEHVLTVADITAIQAWYETVQHLPPSGASRMEKGAHFVNRAMNSDDIESFVNYFVALDAMFGEIHKVENSITTAVGNLGLAQTMCEKLPWLFDLRNELVHGGSRSVKEWPKYQRYYRYFDSKPARDMEKLSFAALLRAPARLAS
jgi:hypothetical protein